MRPIAAACAHCRLSHASVRIRDSIAPSRPDGERLRKRDPAARDELTPQEVQIALAVAEGKTNREVGAQLFLGPKTVEWHFGNTYSKLGVRSRGPAWTRTPLLIDVLLR